MTFIWHDRELPLFDHPYNGTRTNERSVELAIAEAWLGARSFGSKGLEVGNVLAHYANAMVLLPRLVVDRYEQGPRVEPLDVFAIGGAYDWIVSISTLEHVRHGAPEPPNPWGAAAALMYLRGLLAPAGQMLVTVGLGQHPTFDEFLMTTPGSMVVRQGREGPDRRRDEWAEMPPMAGRRRLGRTPYGPTHGANAVWIAEFSA